MKRSELTGLTFGRLTVVGLSEVSRNGHTRWHVKCECGTEKTTLGTHLLQGKTISCGCAMRENGKRNWKGGEEVSATYFSSLKRGALGEKSRNPIDFKITLEYIDQLYKNQKGLCNYSKMPISIRARTASLDRIDSSQGYIEGNVQWLHKDVNMMKRHYTEDYFLELCKKIGEAY